MPSNPVGSPMQASPMESSTQGNPSVRSCFFSLNTQTATKRMCKNFRISFCPPRQVAQSSRFFSTQIGVKFDRSQFAGLYVKKWSCEMSDTSIRIVTRDGMLDLLLNETTIATHFDWNEHTCDTKRVSPFRLFLYLNFLNMTRSLTKSPCLVLNQQA